MEHLSALPYDSCILAWDDKLQILFSESDVQSYEQMWLPHVIACIFF